MNAETSVATTLASWFLPTGSIVTELILRS